MNSSFDAYKSILLFIKNAHVKNEYVKFFCKHIHRTFCSNQQVLKPKYKYAFDDNRKKMNALDVNSKMKISWEWGSVNRSPYHSWKDRQTFFVCGNSEIIFWKGMICSWWDNLCGLKQNTVFRWQIEILYAQATATYLFRS